MAKARFDGKNPFEQGQRKWERLAAKFDATVSTSLRGGMLKVHGTSRKHLDRLVYKGGAKAHQRSGMLADSEVLVFRGDRAAELVNTAASVWNGVKTYYAHIIAKGRPAKTKAKGRYAWMKRPNAARPSTLEGWLDAVRAGLAVMSRRMGPMTAKPWCDQAIEEARKQGLIPKEIESGVSRAIRQSGEGFGLPGRIDMPNRRFPPIRTPGDAHALAGSGRWHHRREGPLDRRIRAARG